MYSLFLYWLELSLVQEIEGELTVNSEVAEDTFPSAKYKQFVGSVEWEVDVFNTGCQTKLLADICPPQVDQENHFCDSWRIVPVWSHAF